MPAFVAGHYWTEEDFYAARDSAPYGERWELVDGEVLVTPGPHWSHQRIVFALGVMLDAYVREHAFGEVFLSPCDVKLEPGLVMQPDLFVVPNGLLIKRDAIVNRLVLAVESTSPSSARFDRVVKRPRYQRHRVSEYWIVDPDSRIIERWQPDDERPAILSDHLLWHPAGASSPFDLDVAEFFRKVIPPA